VRLRLGRSDGANYKTQYIFKLPEGAKLKPGDEVPSTVFGISKEDWFSDYLPKGYDKEIDHNQLEVVKVRNKARYDVLSERFKTGGMILPDNIDAAINKLKTSLIKKAQSKGISENFGQKEVRMLEDKFGFSTKVNEFDNWASQYSFAKGGILSNKETIHDLQFEDDTDSRHGKYNFSFFTKDAEGADVLDYDGYIIVSPPLSEMDDEIEWGQNTPEDWEGAEKFIIDSFYDWKQQQTSKQKRFADGRNAEGESDYKKGGFRFNPGDIVYLFQYHNKEKINPAYIVKNQKWAKVEILEPWSDELYNETYKVKFIEGASQDFEDKLRKKGDIFVAHQGQMSKSNKRPISLGYLDEIIKAEKEDGYAKGGQLFKHKHMDATAKILEQTNKGYKVEFTDNSAKNPKAKIKFFNKIDFDKDKGLFELVKEEAEIPKVDLFEHPELIPKPVSEILNRFQEEADGDELSYEQLKQMLDEVHNEGYTFEYGLDAVPYGLRPVHVALEELEDGYVEVEDTNAFAEGGKVNGGKTLTKGNSLKYYIANFLSSGTVGSYTGLWTYKDIDAVKSIAINILDEEGDVEYSIEKMQKVLNEAVMKYKGKKPILENADDYWQWVNTDTKGGPYIYKNRDREISIQSHPTKAWHFITEILKGSVTEKELDDFADNFSATGIDQHEFKGGFYEAILKIPVEYKKSKEVVSLLEKVNNLWAETKYCIKKDGQYLTRKSLTSSLVFTDNPEFRYTWPESEKENAQKLAEQFNAILVPDKEHSLYAEGGNVDTRKSGNVPAIEKRVAEINELIARANKNDLRIIDESTTWQAPMKYKPIKYSNGTLYLEYEELDLYKHNKGLGSHWETKKDTVKKSNMRDQLIELSGISRLYKKALKHFDTYGYGRYAKGGGINGTLHTTYANPIDFLIAMGAEPDLSRDFYTQKNHIRYFIGYKDNKAIVVAFVEDDKNYMIDKEDARQMSSNAKYMGMTKGTEIIELNTNYGLELHSKHEDPRTIGFDKIYKIIIGGKYATGGKLNSNSKYIMKPSKKWAVTVMLPNDKTAINGKKVKIIELGPESDKFDVKMAIERKVAGGDEDFIKGEILSIVEQNTGEVINKEPGFMVVGKKNGQLVEISENPMSNRNCEEFIYEQGVEKYYSDVDIIPYRGTKANFQYNSRPGTKFKFATGGSVGQKIKVGTFDETQLKKGEDKIATQKAIAETGLKYTETKIIKKGGKMFLEVYLMPDEQYYNSSKFATGGNLDDLSPLEYFQALDLSTLPADFADFIKTDILTDPDLADLSPLEPAFIEIKEKIEKAHNVAAAATPSDNAKPVEISEEDASRAETLEAIRFLEILVEDQEGAEKEETLEAIGFLKELL
jgi:hypothetical protein